MAPTNADDGSCTGGNERFRKLAPKQSVQLPDKVHPDWFWSLSGGIDSTAAFLLTKDIGENYGRTPVAVHLNTRIGTPLNLLYLEELTRVYGVQLINWYTEEDFREWVGRDDCPGPGAHQEVRNELKDRQASKLISLADFPIMIIGIRRDESDTRASFGKARQMRRHLEVYPVYELSQKECARIILEHENCPINPLWIWPEVIKDCGCLSNGDPSELDKTEEKFPWFAQRLREIEEAADADGLRGVLGWGGLTAMERSLLKNGHEQMTLCSEGCGRERDPDVVRAFRARIHGATKDEALSILDSDVSDGPELIAATDGGIDGDWNTE